MPLYESSIKGVLLTNGAVFYAKVQNLGDRYIAHEPISFRLTDEGLIPQAFLPSDDEQFEIERIHVMTTFTPTPQIAEVYAELTRTIVTPPQQGIILP